MDQLGLKTPKRISTNPTKMEQENEETNFEFERINCNSYSPRAFSPANKKSQFHINPNPNRQNRSDPFQKPLHDNQENMVFDRPKQDGSEFQTN
jgi:hypothetical protein